MRKTICCNLSSLSRKENYQILIFISFTIKKVILEKLDKVKSFPSA